MLRRNLLAYAGARAVAVSAGVFSRAPGRVTCLAPDRSPCRVAAHGTLAARLFGMPLPSPAGNQGGGCPCLRSGGRRWEGAGQPAEIEVKLAVVQRV